MADSIGLGDDLVEFVVGIGGDLGIGGAVNDHTAVRIRMGLDPNVDRRAVITAVVLIDHLDVIRVGDHDHTTVLVKDKPAGVPVLIGGNDLIAFAVEIVLDGVACGRVSDLGTGLSNKIIVVVKGKIRSIPVLQSRDFGGRQFRDKFALAIDIGIAVFFTPFAPIGIIGGRNGLAIGIDDGNPVANGVIAVLGRMALGVQLRDSMVLRIVTITQDASLGFIGQLGTDDDLHLVKIRVKGIAGHITVGFGNLLDQVIVAEGVTGNIAVVILDAHPVTHAVIGIASGITGQIAVGPFDLGRDHLDQTIVLAIDIAGLVAPGIDD